MRFARIDCGQDRGFGLVMGFWLWLSVSAAAAGLNEGKLREIDFAITNAIAAGRIPGGVFYMERAGEGYLKAYGDRALTPAREEMTGDTVFDLASLTKVVATAPAVMLLIERGKVELDERVEKYVPEFTGGGREAVTVRHLLTHTSGLRPGISSAGWTGHEGAIGQACRETLRSVPGEVFVYSDINFFLLGDLVQRVAGQPFAEFVREEIYRPLGMNDTGFLPPAEQRSRIAPTQQIGETMLRGVVHDPTARAMGGVAGHAGLFSTAADLARFARMMLNKGQLDGVRVFEPETIVEMTRVQTPPEMGVRRGLGWDIDTGYSGPRGKLFPIGSYGHTGFTGTSLWMDPHSGTFWMLLSSRVHPDGKGSVVPLRSTLALLAAEAVERFDFSYVRGALPPRVDGGREETPRTRTVLNGIDVLAREKFAALSGLRVGLVTNHTGRDRGRNLTIDLLHQSEAVQLMALFSPEHGIRGLLDEQVGDGRDERTGLPVYSLYGVRRAPSAEQLMDLDALVFDIQDIGCRFYTYISTLGNCMKAAGEAKLKFFVLDRVNPINGKAVEGPVYAGESKFVAYHSLPLRHGMTVGELAGMFNAELEFGVDLTVIGLEGWERGLWFDQTGLPWTNPSPNMRSLAQATLYPGVGLQEMALSVGRGTDTPFEVLGAPYIDDQRLAAELNKAGLAGVRFVPVRFTPRASVFKDQECGGVNVIVTDRDRLRPVDLGIVIGLTLQRLYPAEYALGKLNTLMLDEGILAAVGEGKTLVEIRSGWQVGLDEFRKRRAQFLLY